MSHKIYFVGIDWATQAHAVCVIDGSGKVLGERAFKHSGEGLAALAVWLEQTTSAVPTAIRVAIEVPHGPVVETLLERGFSVNAINPKQLDRFRDRFTVGGAKDDRRDARVLADSLRTDPTCFRVLVVDRAEVIQLREWSRMAEELVEQRVRESNRIRQILIRYYPQILELLDEPWNRFFLALWELVPTPQAAAKVRAARVDQLLKQFRVRKLNAKQIVVALRQKALSVAPGTVDACVAHIRSLARRIELISREHDEALAQIELLTERLAESQQKAERRDVEVLRSLPGIGRVVLATLLAEASGVLETRDYHALRLLTGVAPVTRQSGKRSVVTMRRGCHVRLRNAVFYWAQSAAVYDATSKARYKLLRERGHSRGRALRAVADRLLHVACAMLRHGQTFDRERAVAAPCGHAPRPSSA